MIEIQLVWAREGQLCLWGIDGGRLIDAATLERQLEAAVGPAAESPIRRVLSLELPEHGFSLVPALEPATAELLALLQRVAEEADLAIAGERTQLAAGLAVGDSLRLVAQLDRLAFELIAGGRFLPHVKRNEINWRAGWSAAPVLTKDRERIATLADAAPGSLFAAGVEADIGSGESTAGPIEAILDYLIDSRIRSLLSTDLSRQVRRGPNRAGGDTFSHLHAWSEALTTHSGAIEATNPSFAIFAGELGEWSRESSSPPVNQSAQVLASEVAEHRPESETENKTTRAPRHLTVTLKTSPVTPPPGADSTPEDGRLFALDGLCEFEWRVAVGDQRLTVAELRELAAAQLPLIKAGGRWTVVSTAQVNGALEAIERHGERGRAHAGELLRDSLTLAPGARAPGAGSPRSGTAHGGAVAAPESAASTQTGTAPIEFEPQGWLKLLTGEGDSKLAEPDQPAGLNGRLRPYQRRGFAWLDLLSQLGLGACLADDMGLGKTIQLLALLLAERERSALTAGGPGEAAGRSPATYPPTLLVAPVSVVGNWKREAERFAPDLQLMLHHGPQRLRGPAFRAAAQKADLVITSYSIVTRDRDLLGSIAWDRIALDEAQNIKSRRARQTQAIRALPARHRIALTGTPVENRLTELHSIMDFLNPGLLGSADAFKQQIARPIEQWRDPDAAAQLRQATSPFILRRLKTDRTIVPELPEKIEMRTDCLLTREQASLYQAVVDDLMTAADQPEGIARSGAILAALTRLKQVCNHPGQLLGDDSRFAGRSGKLDRLEEILEEALSEGDRALCFTQFSGFGQRLAWHLAELFDREVLFLHGGSSREERDEMVERFQDTDGPSIFVLSLRAGGTGLNLTAANQVIHFDRWWNPAVEDQATDRAYRIGQKRNVQVRKLTCVGTLEERIDTLLDRKRDLAEMIVGSGESWITELDRAQLKELVALSPEAVDPAGDAPTERPRSIAAPDDALAA